MIRTLLALDGALVRGALALVLDAQHDIRVVAELDRGDRVRPVVREHRPDVAVVDLALLEGDVHEAVAPCPVLVLADPRRARDLCDMLAEGRAVGILGTDVAPQAVVDGVRRLARGEPVVDADLVVAALAEASPLTGREAEILTLTAAGSPVGEIAAALGLSPGTVRNNLTRITHKCGARTRVEAVRIARESGWI
ncbi:helix-turn-helix transcriptional regulator [Micromonospora rosaria]|uniref:Helix-turn-helix transcriptional regulator n=1 Tax=Micromonospora rosaria TaxID=47874 RepID=A0A136PK82_9ACTN|nr:response regulator transcription factor [Micromonospora rosaria]KXK58832.1 helix-turn-helix transcriptional regulator [Micromonospora rosaria]